MKFMQNNNAPKIEHKNINKPQINETQDKKN